MEDVLFIVSSSRETGTAQLAKHILSEASATYPQLAEIRHLEVPQQESTLKGWSSWLAVEVLEQWLDAAPVGISVDAVLAKLGLANAETQTATLLSTLNSGAAGVPVTSELSARIQAIRYQYHQIKDSQTHWQPWLDQEKLKLSTWISQVSRTPSNRSTMMGMERIQFNADALQIRNQLYLKESLMSWRQSGIHSTLKFLQALGERLTYIYAEYDRQQQIFERKEASAWRAFDNLSAQLQPQSFRSKKRPVQVETVLQALLKANNFKLEAEIYRQACQLVGRLRQEVHLLAYEFVQSHRFLIQLKQEFMQDSPSDPFFAPLLLQALTQRFDLLKFRRKIETLVSCPAYLWGGLRQSQKVVVRQQILSQLASLCLEVYAKCHASLRSLQISGASLESMNNHSTSLIAKNALDNSKVLKERSF